MNADEVLAELGELCGIVPKYHDLQGAERPITPETRRALLAANGIDISTEATAHDALAALRDAHESRWFPDEIIVESDSPSRQGFGLGAAWQLRAEDEEAVFAEGQADDQITLPALPSGIYELTASASGRTEKTVVLAAPKRLPTIGELTGRNRLWGLNLALYGLRSQRNSGLGDFEDLARISEAAAATGAGFVGINPLHNMGFSDTQAISPYSPSDRGFLNTSYIAPDAIPGLKKTPEPSAFQAIRDAETVQYSDQKTKHNALLETHYTQFLDAASAQARADFAQFKTRRGAELIDFAHFEALSELYGPDWRRWPDNPADPDPSRAKFHKWLQWVADTQLEAAQTRAKASGMPLGLYLDLAVGPRRDGAECWRERAAVASGVSLGAPPDHLSPAGQNWNLAAFAPSKLRSLRYAPLRRVLRQVMRHAGIIRIDHVLGLNRSFWVPDDGSPGGYVRQPFEALLAIIKIEAERYNCAVIGEDLGLVPDGFRETMRSHGFYGYSVMQYEKDAQGAFRSPEDGPEQVLSCFATHDTPTVRGYETGRDIDWWHRLDWIDAATATDLHDTRANEVATFRQEDDFQVKVHTHLAQSKAGLVAVQLDDVLDTIEAQNLPGTIDEHPNWRRKYDVTLEDLPTDTGLRDTAKIMAKADRIMLQEDLLHEG